jgi:hypothetical protein
MALFPAPAILSYLPSINDVAHQVQGLAGVVLEKIVELISLAVSCAKVYVANCYRSIGSLFFFHK